MRLEKKNSEIRKASAVAATPFAHDIMSKYRAKGGIRNSAGRLKMLHAKRNAEVSVVQNHIHVKISTPKQDPKVMIPGSSKELKAERLSSDSAKDKIIQKETLRIETETIIMKEIVHVIEKQRAIREHAVTQPVQFTVKFDAKHDNHQKNGKVSLSTNKQIVEVSNNLKSINQRKLAISLSESLVREEWERKLNVHIQMLQSKLKHPIVIHTIHPRFHSARNQAIPANRQTGATLKPYAVELSTETALQKPASEAKNARLARDLHRLTDANEITVSRVDKRQAAASHSPDNNEHVGKPRQAGRLVLQPRAAANTKGIKPLQLLNARRDSKENIKDYGTSGETKMNVRLNRPLGNEAGKIVRTNGSRGSKDVRSHELVNRRQEGSEAGTASDMNGQRSEGISKAGKPSDKSSGRQNDRPLNRTESSADAQNMEQRRLSASAASKNARLERSGAGADEASARTRAVDKGQDQTKAKAGMQGILAVQHKTGRDIRLLQYTVAVGKHKRRKVVTEHLALAIRKPIQISHSESAKLKRSARREITATLMNRLANPEYVMNKNQESINLSDKRITDRENESNSSRIMPITRLLQQSSRLRPFIIGHASKLTHWNSATGQSMISMIVKKKRAARQIPSSERNAAEKSRVNAKLTADKNKNAQGKTSERTNQQSSVEPSKKQSISKIGRAHV